MKHNFSTYHIARVTVSLACVIFFVLQSYQQMDKFFSKMTSVSTRTMRGVAVRIPNIIVCLEEPFKTNKYPKSLEEFYDITYSADEVFYNLSDELKVTSIATWEGMCFLLKRSNGSDHTRFFLTFNMTKHIKVYYVDKGQELCLKYGLVNCDVQIEAVLSKGYGNDIAVSTKKFLRVPGTCTSDETYSRYDCVEEYVNRKIKDEVSCILSMQAHNEPNTNKTICSNMTLFYNTERTLHDITYEGMSTKSGCKPSCEEWTYNAVQQSHSRENLQVVSAINWTPPYIYTVIRTSEVAVEEEYMVYDFNGIVGTVGGSLGLFVGFSFLQCMLYVLSSLHNECKK